MTSAGESIPKSVVAALGLTQIIGYGTLYYSFGILAPDMAKEIGWSVDGVFALFSGSLLVGGMVAPLLGSLMDRYGAVRLMAFGSLLAAVSLVLCAFSASAATFIAAIVLLEIASGMVQYQAAFAALVEIRPMVAARSITYLTLIAGFASTLFWPVTSGLHGMLSWRDVFLIYAVLNLIVCAPIHFWLMRSRVGIGGHVTDARASSHVEGVLGPAHRKLGFYMASAGFALEGFALSSMLVHMVPMLTGLGLGTAAVLVSMIFGPSQVLSRLINMVFGKRISAPLLALFSACLIVGAIAALLASGGWIIGAVAFALLLGLGSGINSIVQGALPLHLFGSAGYGALTGRMAAIRLMAAAAAPFAFAWGTQRLGVEAPLALVALLGGVGVLAFGSLWALANRSWSARSLK